MLLGLTDIAPDCDANAGAESSAVQEDSSPSAYVPPHLRGRGGKTSAPQFSLGHSTDQAGRIRSETQQQQTPGVPGGFIRLIEFVPWWQSLLVEARVVCSAPLYHIYGVSFMLFIIEHLGSQASSAIKS